MTIILCLVASVTHHRPVVRIYHMAGTEDNLWCLYGVSVGIVDFLTALISLLSLALPRGEIRLRVLQMIRAEFIFQLARSSRLSTDGL
jgi:hypothetical protein